MIKQLALLKAKAGISREAFIQRYEENHAPLVLKTLPYFCAYRRNYIIPGSMVTMAHIGKAAPAPAFDVVTELWYDDRSQVDLLSQAVARTPAGQIIADDEAHLFDRSKLTMFSVVECVTPPERLAPKQEGPHAITMFCMIRKNPNISREAFIDYYENGHAVLATNTMIKDGRRLFAEYRRSYPVPGSAVKVGDHAVHPADPDFDVMTEIRFWTMADYQEFQAICADPEMAKIITTDEEKLFDRSTMTLFHVEPHTTRPSDVAAALAKAG